jgi:single-strand DNA-binding protein
MNHLNSILIEGSLVRDPLFRTTAKGTALCTFAIATNRFYKQEGNLEKETNFFEIESWTKTAEKMKAQGRKGRGVRVVGRLKQSRWTDTEGKVKSRTYIIAEHIEFRPDMRRDEHEDAADGHTDYFADPAYADETVAAF